MLNPQPWQIMLRQTVSANAGRAVVGHFTIQPLNFFSTFRVRLSAFAAGSALVELRFGFEDADADACLYGINFPALAAANASAWATVVYDAAAVPPGVIGNPLAVLPPRVAVYLTAAGGADYSFDIYYCGLYIP